MRVLYALDYKCQSVDFALLLQAAEDIEVEVTLARVDGGSLGFNIMGGAEVNGTNVILDKRNALNCHLYENFVRVARTNPVLRSAWYATWTQFSAIHVCVVKYSFVCSFVFFTSRSYLRGAQRSLPRHVV